MKSIAAPNNSFKRTGPVGAAAYLKRWYQIPGECLETDETGES